MDAEYRGPSAGVVGQPGAATGVRARLAAVTLDQWLALGVFLAAIAGSSVTWYALAIRCQFPPVLAAVPAIGLDLGGVVFGRNWILGGSARLRTWGMITTILAVALSVIGNGAEHAIAAGLLDVTLLMVVVVGSVPAAVLFAVVHQVALATGPAPERVNGSGEVTGKRPGGQRQSEPVYTRAEPAAGVSHPETEASRDETGGPEPATGATSAAATPRPNGTVVELSRRPAEGTKLAIAHDEYLRRAAALLDRGKSLDDIVLAEIDRHAGASAGYAKKHARTWRVEAEAAHRQRGEG